MTLPPPSNDFITTDGPCPGIQRLRAGFLGHAYDPHRHETYAIGVTEHGVQAFRYRGADCVSTAGLTMVLQQVKTAIAEGLPLAEAAAEGGFADQSHMTRHFKARFGLTPGRYARLLRRSRN